MNTSQRILDAEAIRQKIRRMAFEIYENHFGDEVLVLAGIDGQGYQLAQALQSALQAISSQEVRLLKISLDKASPSQSEVVLDQEAAYWAGRPVILVDDVLNTGRTLAYSLRPFLKERISSLEIAVLVNRSHTVFPVQAKYKGYELATTLNDHIRVSLAEEAAFLE